MNAQYILEEALALAADQRSAVAEALIDSLGGDAEADVARAWDKEITRRREALKLGKTRTISLDEAKARLNAL